MDTISKIIPKVVRNRIEGIYFRQCLESTFPSSRYDFCRCEYRDPKDEN